MKSSTTVAMDYGRITLGDDMWVQIYGTPGQARFDFMWELLLIGAHGYIVLVPAHLPASIKEARHIRSFMRERSDVPFIIGITHADHPDAWGIDEIQAALADEDNDQPYIFVNPNEPCSSANAMMLLIEQMMQLLVPEEMLVT